MASVEATLEGCEQIPSSVRLLLASAVAMSLGIKKEDRHEFQRDFVEMIGEVFDVIAADKQQQIEAAERTFEEGTSTKSTLEAEVTNASEEVKRREDELARCAEADTAAAAALEAAGKAAEEAQQRAAAWDMEILGIAQRSELLKRLRAVVMRDVAVDRKNIQELCAVARELKFDSGMLDVMPIVLAKTPSRRAKFDNFSVSELISRLDRHIASADEEIAGGAETKTARNAAVETAQSERDAAAALKEDSEKKVVAATAALKESREIVAATKSKVKESLAMLKELKGELSYAQADFSRFRTGPMAAFVELKDLAEEPAAASDAMEGDEASVA